MVLCNCFFRSLDFSPLYFGPKHLVCIHETLFPSSFSFWFNSTPTNYSQCAYFQSSMHFFHCRIFYSNSSMIFFPSGLMILVDRVLVSHGLTRWMTQSKGILYSYKQIEHVAHVEKLLVELVALKSLILLRCLPLVRRMCRSSISSKLSSSFRICWQYAIIFSSLHVHYLFT